MTSPTIGLSLSPPVHLVHVFGLPLSSLGSVRPTILPKSLPPSSYSCTSDLTLPLLSSTVFHLPTSESAATDMFVPSATANPRNAGSHLICVLRCRQAADGSMATLPAGRRVVDHRG